MLVIIWHETRQVVHFNVTRHPTGMWAAQQIVEACPYDTLSKYLLRDRDGIYNEYFQSRIQNMGINEVKTAPKSPWQNPYIERLIGSIRRDVRENAVFQYKVDNLYSGKHDRGIAFDDPEIGIDWIVPEDNLMLSNKDKSNPKLKEAELF
ncbi:MAG: dTDP-4-dehydrorhamnose 3,5-epimerase family protein [Desulfobacteraceae bacterium]|nr:dTDP-4-dehydrorhamnose 3,5-epimerase family protein [Desulfobacteraceae bacterium]